MTKPIEDSTNAAAIRTALGVPTTAALDAKYTKPSGGIPATDLDADPAGRVLLTATSASERKQVLGLDQVNNTSDANKPISTAQQTALDAKMAATLPAMQTVFDAGTAPQKAAFQSSVSGALGSYRLSNTLDTLMRNARGANHYDLGVMASPPTVTEGGAAPSGGVFVAAHTDPGYFGFVGIPAMPTVFATTSASSYLQMFGPRSAAGGYSSAVNFGLIEFDLDSPHFGINVWANSQPWRVRVDGQLISQAGQIKSGANGLITIQHANYVRKTRRYQLEMVNGQRLINMVIGGNDVLRPVRRPMTICVMADSFIAGTTSPQALQNEGMTNALQAISGANVIGHGIPGSGIATANAYTNSYRLDDAVATNADVIWCWGSINDMTATGAALNTGVKAIILGLRSRGFAGPIVFDGAVPLYTGATEALAFETAVSGAIVEAGDPGVAWAPLNTVSPTNAAWMTGDGASVEFTAPLVSATSGTLTGAWQGATGTYTMLFDGPVSRSVTLTSGSAAVSWTTALSSDVEASVYTSVKGPRGTMIGGDRSHPSRLGVPRIARAKLGALLRGLQSIKA